MRDTPSHVFEGWKAYWRVRPFGDDWWQAGVIASAATNPHVRKSKTPADFIPMMKKSVGHTNTDDMEQALMAMCGVKQ